MISIAINLWQAIRGGTTGAALGAGDHAGSDLMKRNGVSLLLKRDGISSIQKGH